MRSVPAVAGCLLLALAVYAGAFHVGPVQDADAALLAFFTGFDDTPVEFFSETIVDLVKPPVYAMICLAVLMLAWRRAGLLPALAGAAAIAGANVMSRLVKLAVAEPRPHAETARQIEALSWPSGHVTATTIVVLVVLLLVVPEASRGRAAVAGALLVAGMSIAVVANNWHYPSDALGGIAVAGAWGAAAAAWLSSRRPAATAAHRRRWQRATG